MAITVKIPTQLRPVVGGQSQVEIEAAGTVADVLDSLYASFPELESRICQDGELRRFVNVYVADEDIRFGDGLETAVADGTEVTILPAVAGG
ncbi:MAG: MoaD family protein [Thermoleophilaceae bacterium]|nr:MoaD family protein [Thermoleophilaceae bacterium]